jgi:hypothetical protein
MFFSKLQRFQADAIDQKISLITSQALEAGLDALDDDSDSVLDFQ